MKADFKAMITGSFDPITLGHMDIIERASRLFPNVYVVMFINTNKKYMFEESQRLDFIKKSCARLENVTVDFSRGMVVDYVREKGISLIVRGIRGDEDIAYEKTMAEYNFEHSGVETMFLPAKPCHAEISSTLVRCSLGKEEKGDLHKLIPEEIANELIDNKIG